MIKTDDNKKDVCPNCNGSGFGPHDYLGHHHTCAWCKGKGFINSLKPKGE